MKALKFTLIVAVIFASFTSCVEQDLNEDDVLLSPNETQAIYKDGIVDER